MADIVNRFESATETLQHSSKEENTQNASSIDHSITENQMDQSEDDSYYQKQGKYIYFNLFYISAFMLNEYFFLLLYHSCC